MRPGPDPVENPVDHLSVITQTVLVAVEEYLSVRETAEILADPAALRGLADARDAEQAGDVICTGEGKRSSLPGDDQPIG